MGTEKHLLDHGPRRALRSRHEHSEEDIAAIYVATFAGRTDAYVLWTGTGWVSVRRELTAQVALGALKGNAPLAFYFHGKDGLTHVAALDFDTGGDGWDQTLAVGSFMWEHGIASYAEPSNRGGHLWMVLDDRRPAPEVRRALRAALQQCGLPDDGRAIELRPASDSPTGLGAALRGPFMSHPRTGLWGGLCDPRTRSPIAANVADSLIEVELASAHHLATLANSCRQSVQVRVPRHTTPEPGAGKDPRRFLRETVGVSRILRDEFGITEAHPGRTVRCPGHDDRHPSLCISVCRRAARTLRSRLLTQRSDGQLRDGRPGPCGRAE